MPENNCPFTHIGHFKDVALKNAWPTESGGAAVIGREFGVILFCDLFSGFDDRERSQRTLEQSDPRCFQSSARDLLTAGNPRGGFSIIGRRDGQCAQAVKSVSGSRSLSPGKQSISGNC